MLPDVRLDSVSREDVQRIAEWLKDPEVNASWYGADEQGEPVHIGYSPDQLLKASPAEWDEVFKRRNTKSILSVYRRGGSI